MHIITRKRLNEFVAEHPTSKTSLLQWYQMIKNNNFDSFVELRTFFPSAYQVGKLTVFNIGGNKARLIAAIHYNRQKVYIRAILTHAEYDQNNWKE
ncbi:MAG TPA: type II toxin-antitoxin system HigB family toxin [Allocoleopsis sp.]